MPLRKPEEDFFFCFFGFGATGAIAEGALTEARTTLK